MDKPFCSPPPKIQKHGQSEVKITLVSLEFFISKVIFCIFNYRHKGNLWKFCLIFAAEASLFSDQQHWLGREKLFHLALSINIWQWCAKHLLWPFLSGLSSNIRDPLIKKWPGAFHTCAFKSIASHTLSAHSVWWTRALSPCSAEWKMWDVIQQQLQRDVKTKNGHWRCHLLQERDKSSIPSHFKIIGICQW